MNDFRHRRFSSIVLLMTCMFLSKGTAQVDFTQALLWGTYTSTGLPQLKFFYGNPSTYVPDLANGRNGSYSSSNYTFDSGGHVLGAVDMLYSESCLSYSFDMQLFFSCQLLRQNGSLIFYTSVPVYSNVVPGVSIDWVSRLVYWSDASYQRICMLDIISYGIWRVVVDTNLTSPQDVVVYPQQSLLFWSDFGDKSVIERYNLATDDRRILLSSPTLQRPTKLVVDFATQRLFWLDAAAATIGSMNFDGSSVSLWPPSSTFSSVSSFALFQNYIFIGRNDVNVIYIYDRNQQYKANITQDGKGIVDMTVYSQERNPSVSSPCTTGKGGCAQLCITVNSTQRRCMCEMGLFLASNGVDCVTNPMQIDKFLIVSDEWQVNIFQINVDTGEVRALTDSTRVYSGPTALAFDPLRKNLYYYDKKNLVIRLTSLDGSVSTPLPNVANASGSDITSLAFDSESQVLFYVDYVVQTISAMYLSNLSSITIYSRAGSRPRTIVLDTSNRLLYWSDCGYNGYNTIQRGSKANPNTNRMVIILGLSACVMTFAIDFQNQMIFWADANGLIETAMLDGTARSAIFLGSKADSIGLALDAQFIYITDTTTRRIQKIDRNTKQLSNLTKILFSRPFALLYYSMDTASTETTSTTKTTSGDKTTSTTKTTSGDKTVSLSKTTSTSTTTTTSTSLATSMRLTISNSSTPDNNGVTTIVLPSVIGGSVVLIAVFVTVGVVVVKRRRAISREDEVILEDSADNFPDNESLNADQRNNSNSQVFTNEPYYPDERDYTQTPHIYETISDDNISDNLNLQGFADESHYDDKIIYTSRRRLSADFPSKGPTGSQTVASPVYDDCLLDCL